MVSLKIHLLSSHSHSQWCQQLFLTTISKGKRHNSQDSLTLTCHLLCHLIKDLPNQSANAINASGCTALTKACNITTKQPTHTTTTTTLQLQRQAHIHLTLISSQTTLTTKTSDKANLKTAIKDFKAWSKEDPLVAYADQELAKPTINQKTNATSTADIDLHHTSLTNTSKHPTLIQCLTHVHKGIVEIQVRILIQCLKIMIIRSR